MRQFLQTVRDLWRDPMGRIGMIGIFLLIVVAIIAPTIAPYGPEQMVAMPQLVLKFENYPGFSWQARPAYQDN